MLERFRFRCSTDAKVLSLLGAEVQKRQVQSREQVQVHQSSICKCKKCKCRCRAGADAGAEQQVQSRCIGCVAGAKVQI